MPRERPREDTAWDGSLEETKSADSFSSGFQPPALRIHPAVSARLAFRSGSLGEPAQIPVLWDGVLGRGWMRLEARVRKSLDLLEETIGENVGVKVLPVRPRVEMSSVRGTGTSEVL